MSDATTFADAASATDRDSWLALMERIGDDTGYFEPLGPRHWAFFVDEGPQLLVTFETLESCRERSPGQMPLGHDIARRNGWSHLCVIADGETWYRDRRVWGYFDRLVDDAFFEDFEQVTFFGAGMGGYAACAYCVAAPGATVLALAPRSTLDPSVAGWDDRHITGRRLDFTTRYGFAPDMTDGAAKVFVLHDPAVTLDAMHAALFRRPWATLLRCRHLGADPAVALAHMGALEPLIEAAARGTLTPAEWYRMWRARRSFGPWLRNMLARLGQGDSRVREAVFCRAVTTRLNAPRFRRRLADLTAELDGLGIALPPQRPAPAQP
jgi:hypothetical protein